MEDDGEAEEGDGAVWRKAPALGETVVGDAAFQLCLGFFKKGDLCGAVAFALQWQGVI